MRPFLLALQFLTIVTVRSDLIGSDREMAASRHFYGLVGVLLGGALAVIAWPLSAWLPPLALAGLLLVAWEGFTRFLHADGLADTADAMIHFTSRERALAIMKDSRLGSFAAGALICVYLVKFGALASLPWPALAGALVAAPALGRAAAAMLSVLLPPARAGQGLGAAVAGGGSPAAGLTSAACAVTACGLAAGAPGLWAALAVLMLCAALGWWCLRRIGGVTGDTLGAAIEVSEALALLVLAAF